MSVLGAFYSTWDNARQTYGQGTPETGEKFDNSSKLRQLESGLEAAAPGSRWSGAAATNYDAANTEHRRVISELATLDEKLKTQVDLSAEVVSAGRRDLESLRKWVADMEASIPPGKFGEQMRMALAQKGMAQLQEIVQRSNGESNAIAAEIRKLQGEFEALGSGQRFAKTSKEGDEKEPPEIGAPSPEYQANADVEDALNGEQDAAKRVEDVLNSIKPGEPLNPLQDAYLTQMQIHQKGMSVEDLTRAEERLGDHKNIIADSWQLMSNDDVKYSGGAGDEKKGAASQLPDSVQKALNGAGQTWPLGEGTAQLRYGEELDAIAQIVKDGNPQFQTGTELDRQIMLAADKAMDTQNPFTPTIGMEPTVQGLFEAVDDDHQIINDHLMGRNGADADDFLRDVNTVNWTDEGKAAGYLFSWTNPGEAGFGSQAEAQMAAETAEKYAGYIASNAHGGSNLLSIDGQTLGERNPELVRGYAHGLTPYMDDIGTLSGSNKDGDLFDPLDPTNSERPNAKGLFAVLSTDKDAYVEFNGAADQLGLERASEWANDVKNNVPVSPNDSRMLDAAVLKGLVASGTAEGLHAAGINNADAYEWRKLAYGAGVTGLSAVAGPVGGPIASVFGAAMESSVIGSPPNPEVGTIPAMTGDESARFAVNALLASGVDVPVSVEYLVDAYDENGNKLPYQKVGTLDELENQGRLVIDTELQQYLNDALDQRIGEDHNPSQEFAQRYADITNIPDGKAPGEK